MMNTCVRIIGVILLLAGAVYAANEITANVYLKVDNGDFDLTRNVHQLKRDQVATSMSAGIQLIQTGAWEEVVIAADVATNGYAFFRNITTNTDRWIDVGAVSWATTSYVGFLRLNASDANLVRLHPTNDIYARATSTYTGTVAGVNLEFWVNED